MSEKEKIVRNIRKSSFKTGSISGDVCLAANDVVTLMMTALPNDVAYADVFGKHRIILGVAKYIIFAKQMHHIA